MIKNKNKKPNTPDGSIVSNEITVENRHKRLFMRLKIYRWPIVLIFTYIWWNDEIHLISKILMSNNIKSSVII